MAQRANKSKQSRGRKNRKHGREGRHPAHVRYVAEKRWNINKARRIDRYMRRHPNWKPTNVQPEVRQHMEHD